MNLEPSPADEVAILREGARILRLVNDFHYEESVEREKLTLGQVSAATMAPVVAESLAHVFDNWARMGSFDPDLLHRVGGRETVETVETARWIVDGDHVKPPLSETDERVPE